MAREQDARKRLSRKDFVKGAAVVAGAGALASCAPAAAPGPAETPEPCPTCPPAQECAPCPTPWLPETWDHEADVVVVGYGGGGACAAIEASDAGASVILLEKVPESLRGGNTSVSAAGMAQPYDKDMAVDHLYALCLGNTDYPSTSLELVRAYVENIDGVFEWVSSRGGEWQTEGLQHDAAWNFVTGELGSDVAGPGSLHESGFDDMTPVDKGYGFFKFLSGLVEGKEIQVMYETPAQGLVQDPRTKEILGVKATNSSGEDIYLKARKGVVMALGGYENSPELQSQFLIPGIRLYPSGTPGNTGDGVYMVQEVGAALWHMNSATTARPGFLVPGRLMTPPQEWDGPYRVALGKGKQHSYIVVNKYGNRFADVLGIQNYTKKGSLMSSTPFLYFDGNTFDPTEKGEYTNIPFFLIFDESRRLAGSWAVDGLPGVQYGFAGGKGLYTWSEDCSKELENGLITQAGTIGELATKLGIDATGLEATVAKYNGYCAAGEDADFGRRADTLHPLVTPPFYGTSLCLQISCTQGGPKRNGNAEVVDKNDKAIPRLYAAGEFGGIQGAMFHGTLCLDDAVMTGALAGRNAAALEPWD
jgi:succinate dehydrogenase/fumarate reductase flavoprotein subunit